MFGVTSGNIGPYELRGELGRGAMARVWRAWDPNLEREVAIKEPLYDYRLSAEVLEEMGRRFVAEGRAAAKLNHPGIVAIYAADVWDGHPAIVMELVEGETLARRLTRGALPPAEALSVLDQLLDAVGYAHAHGVIHRDIKPDNIFITPAGQVKLADFGIAHNDGSSVAHATVAGTVLGTPGYMSPEQAVGRAVDARSDLFSVGVVGYEMLTGRNPFGVGEGTEATALIYRIVHEPVPELPPEATYGLPADMRPAIMAALEKDPDRRPASAEAFRSLLYGAQPPRNPTGVVPQVTVGKTGTGHGGPRSPLLPYLLVFAVGVAVMAIVLASAMSTPRGGGGSSAALPATTQDQGGAANDASAATESPATESPAAEEAATESAEAPAAEDGQPASGGLYVGIQDGEVAIFREGDDSPVLVSLYISEMAAEDVASAAAHVPVSSYDEAWEIIDEYRARAKAKANQQEVEQAVYPPSFSQVTSSSELPGDTITPYYGPLNALKDDYSLSWNEGVKGHGVGEWIELYAYPAQRVCGVEIVNGYPKSEEIYYKNNRCKDVTIELSDGARFEITLEDLYRESQYIDFGEDHAVTSIRITIGSVYEGSAWDDTSISYVRAY